MILAWVLAVLCGLVTTGLFLLVVLANGMADRPTNGLEGVELIFLPLFLTIVFTLVALMGG